MEKLKQLQGHGEWMVLAILTLPTRREMDGIPHHKTMLWREKIARLEELKSK